MRVLPSSRCLAIVCLAVLCLVGQTALATITDTGDVNPTPASTWAAGTNGIIGNTLTTGSVSVDGTGGGSTLLAGTCTIGYLGGASGTLTVDNSAATTAKLVDSGILYIGSSGTGTLGITFNGTVTNTIAYLGYNAGAAGVASVSGANSKWINSGILSVGGGTVSGLSGSGTLTITSGGSVSDTSGYLGYVAGAYGSASVDGTLGTGIWKNSAPLYIGSSGTGTLTITAGGSVSDTIGYIGALVGGTGSVSVGGLNSKWVNSSNLYVGGTVTSGGTGTLSVTSGGIVSASSAYIANGSGSYGTVTVDGSTAAATWNAGGGVVYVGGSGTGTLYVTSGGSAGAGQCSIGYGPTGVGVATVTGNNARFTCQSTFYVGNLGSGTLSVLSGGSMTSGTPHVGYGSSTVPASGSVTVDAATWTSTSGSGEIGYQSGSKGIVTIQNAGTVTFNGSTKIGYLLGSAGTVSVDGANSLWTIGNASDLWVGYQGDGRLKIAHGGSVTGTNNVFVPYTTWGSVSGTGGLSFGVGGGTLSAKTFIAPATQVTGTAGLGNTGTILARGLVTDANLTFNATTGSVTTFSFDSGNVAGTLDLSGGAASSGWLGVGNGTIDIDGIAIGSNAAYEGYFIGSSGTATVRNNGAWLSTSNHYVGFNGNGVLKILSGGTVTNSTVNVGYQSLYGMPPGITTGATGAVTVDGIGSRWDTATLYLGYGDTTYGTLDITNGGLVNASSNVVISSSPSPPSHGTLTVSSNSRLVSSGSVTVGNYGDGRLVVTGGGTVTSANGQVGYYTGGTGSVTVTGAGSTWANSGAVWFGNAGTCNATVNVLAGGSLSSANGYIGSTLGTATVTVDGAGSIWTSSGTITVGYAGATGLNGLGTLNISGGGKVIANCITSGTVAVGTNAMNLNFDGGTLQAGTASNATWIKQGTAAANVYIKDGGAKFDTLAYNMGIGVNLQHGGVAAIDGGLTKLGSGTLALSGTNTYTGWTTVGAGVLSLGQSSCLYDAGNVRVEPSAALDLNFSGSDTVHFLFLGGYPVAAGTYNSSTTPAYFMPNAGNLLVTTSVLPGDANGDGTVNGADLNTVLSNYNQSGMDWFHGDFDINGTVNGSDLNVVLSNYNQSVPLSAAVPEPSTLLLAAAGLAALLAYAWRKRS